MRDRNHQTESTNHPEHKGNHPPNGDHHPSHGNNHRERQGKNPAHRDSGDKDRQLFEFLDEGFFSAEVLRDRTGTIQDWRYLEVNGAVQKHTGLHPSDLVGGLASQSLPGLDTWWLHAVRSVLETQQSAHLEHHALLVDRWYEVTMFPFGPERFAVLYYDTTDKKRRELDAAFLDCVSSELAISSTPADMMQTIGALVGEYLKVSSCTFVEIDDEKGVVTMLYGWARQDGPPLRRSFRLKDFVSEVFESASRAGQVFILRDSACDERVNAAANARVGIGALLAIPFLVNGRWVATAAITNLGPRDWRDEEIALFQEISNRLFSRIDRAKAEEALRLSEEKYRVLFESIGEGFALLKLIFDDEGRPVDWRYLDANPAFEKQTGVDPVGKSKSEITPVVQDYRLRFFGGVAKTRQPARSEEYASTNGRWYSIFASPVDDSDDLVAVIFDDITERKRAEKTLRESEERKSFLLMLTDALRPLAEPTAIQDTATRVVMHYFQTDRCYYSEIEGDMCIIRRESARPGLPSFTGTYPLEALPLLKQAIMTGKPLVVADANTNDLLDEASRQLCLQWQAVSFFKVPVIKEGRPVGVLAAVQSGAREWTNFELELVQEAAERTWAAVERAKAEQQLTRELQDMKQLQEISNRLIEKDDIQSLYEAILDSAMAIMNAGFASIQSVIADKNELHLLAHRNFHPASADYWKCVKGSSTKVCAHALRSMDRVMVHDIGSFPYPMTKEDNDAFCLSGIGSLQTTPLFSRAGNHVGMLSTHWKMPHTASSMELGLFDVLARQAADLIEQKQAQEALRESEERKSFLLMLSDALRHLSDPLAIQDTATRVAMHYFGTERCYYCEIAGNTSIIRRESAREGLPSIAGTYPLDALPLLKAAITSGKPFVVNDANTTELMDESSRRHSLQLQVVSFFKVPVIKEGKPVGVLAAVQGSARNWTNFEIELAREVAERTWAAVERAKAEEQLSRELQDMKQLQEISNRLVEKDDIQSLYEAILDSAMVLMNADFACIQSVIPEKNELYLLAYRNFRPESAEQWRYLKGTTTTSCGYALKTMERVIVSDIDNRFFEMTKDVADFYRSSDVAAVQTTPLFSRDGHHVGMLTTHWKTPHTPSKRELSLFDVLARQAADLIEQKKAQEALREKEHRLSMRWT